MSSAESRDNSSEKERKLIDAAFADVFASRPGETRESARRGSAAPLQPPPGSFSGYEIIREVHRGAQGVVYEAIQEGTQQRVAIKVMREGPFASDDDKARFDREIRILGQLNHPNIVAIHDTGEAAGHFYYVMDFIAGGPLNVGESASERSIEEALRQFGKICEAVNAAHQRGIIHRDLKPGNILIDADGEPQVLDFGLAKITGLGPDDAQERAMTISGQFMGSLPWASPEQAKGALERIDIRTDVYALGVILYQMLTNRFPYEVFGAMRDVLDNIARAEPIRPSSFRRKINDEIETIVLRCLSKEPQRRYQSAGELARDVEHYLAGEPIEAKRDSAWYVLRKFAGRNKTIAASVAAAIVTLVSATAVSIIFLVQANTVARNLEIAEQNALKEAAVAALERQRAYSFILLAAREAINDNDITAAKRYLDTIPVNHRHWEWNRIDAESDRSLTVLRGHDSWVYGAAFSDDGTQIVTAGAFDNTARVWDAVSGEELAVLRGGHEGFVWAASFSPDGSRIVTASQAMLRLPERAPGFARVWDTETGEELALLAGHQFRIVAASFSRDGSRIVTASYDMTARVWDAATGEGIATLFGHEGNVVAASFSPDGTRIVTASDDMTARVWDAATGQEIAVLCGHEDRIEAASFSSDGSRIVTASHDMTARLWDAATGDEIGLLDGHESRIVAASFSPDGSRIVTAAHDSTARVWDAATGDEIAILLEHSDPVVAASFSPDGLRIVTASSDTTARVWDATTGEEVALLRGHESAILAASFSSDGSRIVTASEDNTARVWDSATEEEVVVLRGHQGLVWNSSFSPDGSRVFTAGLKDLTARVWDATTGEQIALLRGHDQQLSGGSFSPDGSRIVTRASDNTARVLDVATGEEIAVLSGHRREVSGASFSPDGTRIVTRSPDMTARVWNAATGQEIALLFGHKLQVLAASFSPDGLRIVTGSGDTTARVWDAATGQQTAVLRGHEDRVLSALFGPDNARIVAASEDNTARVWDAVTGKEVAVLRGHERQIFRASFSPDGSRIVTVSFGTVRVWDVATGQKTAALRGHESRVYSAQFSPDGTRIVTASIDNVARVWDAETGEEVAVLRGHDNEIFRASFSPDGSRIVTSSADGTARVWHSTPWRERKAKIDLYREAMAIVTTSIDEMFESGIEPLQMAVQVRQDQSLTDIERRAALNLIIKRCSDRREVLRALQHLH